MDQTKKGPGRERQDPLRKKAPYRPPRLVRHGNLRDLTTTCTGATSDGGYHIS